MKSRTLLCIAFCLWIGTRSADAQTAGIVGGMNFCSPYSKDEVKGLGGITGYNFGLTLDYYIYNFLHVETGTLISQKGYTYTSAYGWPVKRTFAYLEIPVLLKAVYAPGRSGDTEFYLGLGPSVGYAIYGRESEKDYYSFHEIVFTETYNRLEYGGLGSIGMSYSTGFGFLVVEARYFYGLSKTDIENNTYNSGIGVSVGYAYYMGRKRLKHGNF